MRVNASFNAILILIINILNKYIIKCEQIDFTCAPHNSILMENRLQDLYNDESDSLSNYDIDSMPLEMILLLDKTMAMLEFDSSGKLLERCRLFDLEKEADKAESVVSATGLPVVKCDLKTMQQVINRCRDLSANLITNFNTEQSSSNFTSETSLSLFSLWRGLMPGTLWCGLGDAANSYDDLGSKRDVDLCCRAHDHCPVRLKALRFGYGLINLSLYTKSHCNCDEDFLKCLKATNNSYSAMLGNFYFNVLKVQCIKEEQTVVCVNVRRNINGNDECIRYEMSNEKKMKFVTPEFVY